ncbi:MAG TPA: type IV pilus biogenesis/stability protein PilW [Burkholderiales bacterium]|jgi:type IV pilus assembly protein PilF|nr:type IV pilus biogenesis/stability protein PilW [Burkholderiales bacterium]
MRVAVALAGLLVLCGCISTTKGDPGFKPDMATSSPLEAIRERARVHTELASGYYELANMSVALEEVREALHADSGYGPAYNVAGLIYAELKEDKIAQENFQRALQINPLDSDANNNYGRFLCDRKREDEAIRYFLTALRNPLYQNPDRSYLNAGLCSRRRGDIVAAEDYFQKAVKVRPNQPQAIYQLAELAYTRGAFTQAKAHLNRFGQLANANPEVLWLALRVERKLGDREAAASYGTQLTKNFPESKEAKALIAGRDE